MKTAEPTPAGGKNSHLCNVILLAVLLALLFWKSFLPGYVHFANDGPLGQQMTLRTLALLSFVLHLALPPFGLAPLAPVLAPGILTSVTRADHSPRRDSDLEAGPHRALVADATHVDHIRSELNRVGANPSQVGVRPSGTTSQVIFDGS